MVIDASRKFVVKGSRHVISLHSLGTNNRIVVAVNYVAYVVKFVEQDIVTRKALSLNQAYAMTVSANGNLYFSSQNALYMMEPDSSEKTLLAGGSWQPGYIDSTLTASRFEDLRVRLNNVCLFFISIDNINFKSVVA